MRANNPLAGQSVQSPYDMFKRRIAEAKALDELSPIQLAIETDKRLSKFERINLLEWLLPERREYLAAAVLG